MFGMLCLAKRQIAGLAELGRYLFNYLSIRIVLWVKSIICGVSLQCTRDGFA
jgi:hypothetical protein